MYEKLFQLPDMCRSSSGYIDSSRSCPAVTPWTVDSELWLLQLDISRDRLAVQGFAGYTE